MSALTALQHSAVSTALDDPELLRDLTDGLGSPLHLLLPAVFTENVGRMTATLAELGVEAAVLFAKKANKAHCFVVAAADAGIGVDVASAPELVGALAGGVPGERIGVSGPEKDTALHRLALRHGCLVAVDSLGELRRLVEVARGAPRPARVLLRTRVATQPGSRFGMAATERRAAVELCARNTGPVRLEGFSFHLDGYSSAERAQAANDLIEHCLAARSRGLVGCDVVDIGGGLPVRYVDPGEWAEFLRGDDPAHYHAGKTFGGFYPYGAERPAEQALRDVVNHPVPGHGTLGERAVRHGIRFLVEPGRALLDQAGLTVFRVQQVDDRRADDGYAILTVRGSSFSLSEQWFGSEYLPDPVLLASDTAGAPGTFPASVAGSTCLEGDMLTWRKIGFPRPVVPGDHLVYLNTAGYQMDSNESPFHEVALPRKVVLHVGDGGTRPRWRLDGVDDGVDFGDVDGRGGAPA